MFNTCVKSIKRWRPICFYQNIVVQRYFASFSAKDILYETSDETGTLLTRFAKHIALERLSICEQVPTKVHYADYFPISDIKYFQKQLYRTPADQLAAVILFAFTYRSNADPLKFASILNDIDRYATEQVSEMNVDAMLRTLYSFLFLIPNWMTRLDFYTRAMQHIFDLVVQEGCQTKEMFVQTCFYAGLSKKQTKHALDKLFKKFMECNLEKFLSQLSTLDLAVVSNAAYKTSTLIEGGNFGQRVLKEVLEVAPADLRVHDGLFINFIKSLRFQRIRSNNVCEHLAQICTNEQRLKNFQPRGQMHLFAYFADNLWDNDDCTKPLVEEFLKIIKSSGRNSFSQKVRGKDIATFLWCCAQLNCSLTKEQLRDIESCLLNKVHNKEFNYFPDQLVEACLSLWILNLKSEELLSHAIQLKSKSTTKRPQPKVDSRLTVLLSAAQIEQPSWCTHETRGFEAFNLQTNVPSYLLNSKEIPYQELISKLIQDSLVSKAAISNPINGINLPGILLTLSQPENANIFLEFMSKSQTLQFSGQPVGILRLKHRLLRSMGYRLKVLNAAHTCLPIDCNELLSDETHDQNNQHRITV